MIEILNEGKKNKFSSVKIFNNIIGALNVLKNESIDEVLKSEQELLGVISEDSEYAGISLWFIENVPGADIKAHSQAILKSGSARLNFKIGMLANDDKYAELLKKINIRDHGQIIIDSKDLDYNYKFALFKGADVLAHEQVIVDSKDSYYALIFARYVKGADIKPLEEIVIDSGNTNYCLQFMYIKGSNRKALRRVIEKNLFELNVTMLNKRKIFK